MPVDKKKKNFVLETKNIAHFIFNSHCRRTAAKCLFLFFQQKHLSSSFDQPATVKNGLLLSSLVISNTYR